MPVFQYSFLGALFEKYSHIIVATAGSPDGH